MANLTLRDVSKSFGGFQALSGINLEIAHREFVVVVGPSGCGKSTLLRIVAGLEQLSSGAIYVDDKPVHHIPASQRGLAMVFQNYALYPHMTVAQNMGFALKMAKVDRGETQNRVNQAAGILQIEGLLDRKPRQLSGGQRQRVAIGRAIVREPKVFLFDEPLSNLDAALRVDMRIELAKLHKSIDATMIYVTHDQIEAMTMADKIVVLRDGHIEQVGRPMEIYARPANAFVAGFIGSPRMNQIAATVRAVSSQGLTVTAFGHVKVSVPVTPGAAKVGDKVTLGIRPEHLTVVSDPDSTTLNASIYLAEPLGGETIVYGQVNESETLVVKVSGGMVVEAQGRIAVRIDPGLCHLFGADGKAFEPLEEIAGPREPVIG